MEQTIGIRRCSIFNQPDGSALVEVEDGSRLGICPFKSTNSDRKIKKFSLKSQSNLRRSLRKTRWSKNVFECCLFVPTMAQVRDARAPKAAVMRLLRRKYKECFGYYVLEFKNDAAHYHFMVDFRQVVSAEQLADLCVEIHSVWNKKFFTEDLSLTLRLEPVRSLKAMIKYVSKDEQKIVPKHINRLTRFWGSFGNPDKTPSDVVTFECGETYDQMKSSIALALVANGAPERIIQAFKCSRKMSVILREPAAKSLKGQIESVRVQQQFRDIDVYNPFTTSIVEPLSDSSPYTPHQDDSHPVEQDHEHSGEYLTFTDSEGLLYSVHVGSAMSIEDLELAACFAKYVD